jgi:hypothetical protein
LLVEGDNHVLHMLQAYHPGQHSLSSKGSSNAAAGRDMHSLMGMETMAVRSPRTRKAFTKLIV